MKRVLWRTRYALHGWRVTCIPLRIWWGWSDAAVEKAEDEYVDPVAAADEEISYMYN